MNSSINIEEIMAQIKQDIKDKGLTSDMLSFEDVPYDEPSQVGNNSDAANAALAYLSAHCYIQPYKELSGNPVKVFIQKVIRKLTKFYVEPVVFEQNDFNINNVTMLNYLKQNAEMQVSDDLSGRLEALELANKELVTRLDRLEQENAALREKLGRQGR